jgi:hypothetical protein
MGDSAVALMVRPSSLPRTRTREPLDSDVGAGNVRVRTAPLSSLSP